MRLRTLTILAAVFLAAVVGGYLGLRAFAIAAAERQLLTTYKNDSRTPADYGVSYKALWIDSHGRKLQASLVRAPQSCIAPVAILIFHGRGETNSSWAKAQAFLSAQCVSSLVFDYSGFGSSTPPAHIATLNEDGTSAYLAFVASFPTGRRCILGHSMGNAPMLHDYALFAPHPDCVVVANAFSSVEDMARSGGAPSLLAGLLHGVWDNTIAIKSVSAPLMIVRSDGDQTIPRIVQLHLDEAAPPTARRIVLHGFDHDALYRVPNVAWWAPVLAFLKAKPDETARPANSAD